MKKIVVIGGGHGSSVVLSSLKGQGYELTSAVSMVDDGGSTGKLRRELNVLPPGDVRQCILALSEDQDLIDLMSHRFAKGSLAGHSVGNLLLSGGEELTGSLEQSINMMSKMMNIDGKVLPVTTDSSSLVLSQDSGEVQGEYNIGETKLDSTSPNLKLSPEANITDSARTAILEADLVIIAPGNFYCSIIPPMLVDGMAEALQKTTAKVVSICNLVNMQRHTNNFEVVNYVKEIERFAGPGVIDSVVYNTKEIDPEFLRKGEAMVIAGQEKLNGENYKAIGVEIAHSEKVEFDPNDKIASVRSLVEHDKNKLAEIISELANGS